MGRICQAIGYVTILLCLVPIAFTIATLMGGGSGGWMGALLFCLPWLGAIVGGVLTITFGAILIELRTLNDYASTAAARLDELVRQGRR